MNVTAEVANSSDVAGSETVTLSVDGNVVVNETVTVGGHSTETVTFSRVLVRGTHSVRVNGLSDTRVTVSDLVEIGFESQTVKTTVGDEQTANVFIRM